ncbi:thioesterase II family protein [Streptomyces sp. NPDC004111]|uniref:thioesterase II family protein n=1 Tax=Streptomyces sp. NPDC004111 TaxID=3364690 RepID=UPI0036AB5A70
MTEPRRAPEPRRAKEPKWLLRKPDPEAAARLFCFPYSGCGASMYHRWPRRIGDVEVCLVQLPHRESRVREPHYGTYEELAGPLMEHLLPHLDRPFGFFGHCGGALPGVELAIRLHEEGLPVPRQLFLSSQVAPQDGPYGRFLDMTDDELAVQLGELITSLGGTPDPRLVRLGLGLLGQDLEANRRYHRADPVVLPSGITVVGWTEDREIPMDLMGGWKAWSRDCRQVLLEGEHYDFLHAPRALLDLFSAGLSPSAGSA